MNKVNNLKALKHANRNIGKRFDKYHIRIVRNDQWGERREIWRAVEGDLKDARGLRDILERKIKESNFFKHKKSKQKEGVKYSDFLAAISGNEYKTLQAIGDELNLSRERVRQLLVKHGMTDVPCRLNKGETI